MKIQHLKTVSLLVTTQTVHQMNLLPIIDILSIQQVLTNNQIVENVIKGYLLSDTISQFHSERDR